MIILAMAIGLILFTGESFSSNMTKQDSAIKVGETNLLIALNSDNYGLKTSAAQILGDIKSDKSVIPLMRILHSSNDENMRILAAYSLCKIQNPMGLFAVKQAVRFDNSGRVRKICNNLYMSSIRPELFASKE